uniref:Type III restriction enzyme res subunit n=1 Tax=Pseudomonas phage HRDY3 TaxID=3236930 RepID=A0AB39CE57_9VIRU
MNRINWNKTPLAQQMHQRRQQQEAAMALDAYAALARANADDDEDSDEVDDSSSEFVKSIRTISLEPARNLEYESFFYPKRERNFLVPILESLSDVTANINMFFRFMRLMMGRANSLSSASPEQIENIASQIHVQVFQSKRTKGSIEQDTVNFIRASRRTAHTFHNVYRSKRYNEGIDIVLMGAGADPEKEGLPAPYFGVEDFQLGRSEYLFEHNDHPMTESRRRGAWQSPVGERILAAAREIHMFLFGTLASSERMIHRGVPLNTNFSDIEQIWVKNTGIKIPTAGEIVTDMVVANPFADQFLQIELIKQPSRKVKEVVKKIREDAARPGYGQEPLSPSAVNAKINEALNGENPKATPESELLNLTLRTSIRFTLESDIAHFVTQTPDNERPNLTRANSWFSLYIAQVLRAKVSGTGKAYKISNAAAIKMEHIPRYATSATTLKRIPALREQHGYVVERTKGNAENMYILPNGTMGVRPSIDALQKTTLAEDFEKISEELLELLSRHEIPLAAFQENSGAAYWPWVEANDLERMQQLVKELHSFDGCSLGFDWDFGINIQATSTPGRTVTSTSVGSVTPDSLAIADWLGFNLAKEGEKPMKRSFAQAMYTLNHHEHTAYAYSQAEKVYGAAPDPVAFADSSMIGNLIDLYMRLAYLDNKAPKFPEILSSAMRALNYEKLPSEPGFDYSSKYFESVKPDGTLPDNRKGNVRGIILSLFKTTLDLASGAQGTHLWNEVFESLKSGDNNPRMSEVSLELENNENYFNSSISTTAEFTRLYKYFGGQVFKQILDAINSVEIEHFGNARAGQAQVQMGEIPDYPGQQFTVTLDLKPNAVLYRDVLPFAVMLGKYAPNHETIFAEAQEQVESIQPDPSFSAEDIQVPGLVSEDRAIFPHQESVQSSLRKKNPPTFAILALAPGGGKTGQGVIDVACLMKDMKEAGTVVRPLVICPNGLINTWCEELKYFQGANWNAFPISSDVLSRWTGKNAPGEKFLTDLATNAPPNTLFVSSMTFIQGRNTRVCIGSAQVNFSQNLEMIRRLGCNYVAIDESHNLKSFKSARHRAVKVLTSSTTVKWLRLLTGTIMPDRAKDIEGQIALKAPHVFRAGDIANIRPEEDPQDNVVKIGDRVITTYTPLNGKRAVDKLGHYISFIVKDKKDWAYMLPSAIESFHPVPMVDYDSADGTSPAEIEQQKLHEQLYRLVLDRTMEELKPLLAQKEKAERMAGAESDEDESEDDGGSSDKFVDNDSDFAGEAIKQALWEKNIARFERLIICPQEDEAYKEVFGDLGEGFISRKAKYIANLAARHFNPVKWKRGTRYIELDLVDFEGQLYVARKYNPGETRVALPDNILSKTPVEAPEYWKPEPKGKLIIITRYNASARAIYDALPPTYRGMAVKFTGDEPDRVKAFNDFKTDDRVQILIANEQGMSEGHNLQLASRMIRAEAPWGPGALSQTSARVWRPDAKGAIAAAKGEGGLTRDVIYLDWVLADNTMEVPKLARVISKTFGITRITEAGNPLYKDLLSSVVVPTEKDDARLALSIDMLASTAGLDDEPFNEMEDAYRRLNAVESKEFAEMRATLKADMLPIERAPNIEGSASMELKPFVANQPIPDEYNWGLQNVEVLLRDAEILKNFRETLRTKPVVTEWGTGRIVGFNTRGGQLASLIVNLKNPPAGMPSRVTVQVNMAYIANKNITPEQEQRFFDVNLAGTATDEKRDAARQKRLEEEQRRQQEQEEKEERIRKKQETDRIRVIKKEDSDGKKREDNEKKGRPLNEGIYTTDGSVKIGGGKKMRPTENSKVGVIVDEEEEDFMEEDAAPSKPELSLYPMYYHGFATLEASVEEGEPNLKKFGFQFTPAYAYININNKKKFHAVYDWFYDTFEVDHKQNDLFIAMNTAFDEGQKNKHKLWYRLELAPVSELPAFFTIQKRINKNRNAVRVFPIFTEENIMLCVDIRTNPGIIPWIGKTIPGAGVKWMKNDGEWLYFGKNKTDLKAKIAEVARSVTVSNKDEAVKELADINFKYKTR